MAFLGWTEMSTLLLFINEVDGSSRSSVFRYFLEPRFITSKRRRLFSARRIAKA